ncbi:hypothetical protein BDZ97DRAFT_1917342 [Flammula alnicola]|nr:hypothetical protein BDZ97DRAFT_1917342 [Flammula alnicola]
MGANKQQQWSSQRSLRVAQPQTRRDVDEVVEQQSEAEKNIDSAEEVERDERKQIENSSSGYDDAARQSWPPLPSSFWYYLHLLGPDFLSILIFSSKEKKHIVEWISKKNKAQGFIKKTADITHHPPPNQALIEGLAIKKDRITGQIVILASTVNRSLAKLSSKNLYALYVAQYLGPIKESSAIGRLALTSLEKEGQDVLAGQLTPGHYCIVYGNFCISGQSCSLEGQRVADGVPLQVKRQSPHSKKETIKAYHRLIYVFAHAILVSIDGHPSKYSFLLTDGDKRHAEQLKNLLEHDVSGNGGNVDDENDESGEGDSDNEDSKTENEKSKNNEGQGGEDEDGEDENNEGKSGKIFSPYNICEDYQRPISTLSMNSNNLSTTRVSDDYRFITHNESTLDMKAFRAALERLISETVAELDSLCLDSDFRLTISNLVPDDWRNDDRGYSWVHNADFGSHRLAFLTEIFSNPSNELLEVDASGKLDM